MAEYKLSYTASEIDEALGRKPIIDVRALPETDIKEDCIYRLSTPIVFADGEQIGYVHEVNVLPEAGEPMMGDNGFIAYYNLQDKIVYCYVNSDLETKFGLTEGWYTVEYIYTLFEIPYGGVVDTKSQTTEGLLYVVLNNYTLYVYNDEWVAQKSIGKQGTGSYAEVFNKPTNIASGDYSHAEGDRTEASGNNSHAEGQGTTASGARSHSEGIDTVASGETSHAEGYTTTASGSYSHAEGQETTASGVRSHSEGFKTTANGTNSHAEGYLTTAKGTNSHAEGTGTIASSGGQHVEGMYNISDVDTPNNYGTYAHIIGNGGNADARSNAYTLDWNGNAWYAGDVYVGSTSGTNKDTGSKKLATEEFVTNAVASAGGSGSGTGITVDSEFSLTSTNPLQNKVVAEAFQNVQSEFETMQNEIDILSASGGKTLIGEIALDNTNLTVDENHDGTGFYNIGTDLQTTMANVFSKLDEGFGALVAELIMLDCTITVSCNRSTASKAVNVAESINCIIPYDTEDGTAAYFSFLNNHIRANDIAQGYIANVLNGAMTLTVKFYTIGGGPSTRPDWNQNDSSAPDYIKNRPFYSEVETVFDDNVTTEIDEEFIPGVAIAEHPMTILDNETDLYEVTVDDTVYNYEIKDLQFLGNSYLFIRAMSEAQGMTVEEFIETMMQHDPAIGEMYAQLAINTGETFFILDDSTTDNPVTLFLTEEPETHHFIIKKTTSVKKLSSAMIDWAGGGAPSGLPEVTTEDNDKVLMVVDGKWVVGSIANGDEVYY